MLKTVVVLKLARKSIPEKIEKARYIVKSMTGNVNFTTPVPALSTIITAVNELEKAFLKAQSGRKDDMAV